MTSDRGEAMSKLAGRAAYFIFVGLALYLGWHDGLFVFDGPAGKGKIAVLAVWLVFLAYTLFCDSRESIFSSLGAIMKRHWGRQVMLDLYIGTALVVGVIWLTEGPTAAAIWTIPILLFANLAVLPYVFINFDQIVGRLL